MVINKYGDISPRTAAKAARRFLRVAQAKMLTQRFAQAESISKNNGQILIWRRYELFPAITTPAVEGVTPEGQVATYTDVQCQVQQYIGWVALTDVIQDTHEDPFLKIMTERMGQQAGESVEIVTFDTLKSGTNADYSGTATERIEVTAAIARADVLRVTRTLRRDRAEMIGKIIKATPDVGTAPVPEGYFALCHTDLEADLRNLTGFQEVAAYSTPEKAIPGEFGRCLNVRFCTSQYYEPWAAAGGSSSTMLANGNIPSGATACDVYPIVIFGADAYGAMRLQGYDKADIMVLNPGVARGGDPAGQKGSVSWKLWYGAVILNPAWLVRLEVACTARPA